MNLKKERRIVLAHTTSPHAGLTQIMGRVTEYPPAIHDVKVGERVVSFHHQKTKPRYVQYLEWAQAPTGQLNDFNPAQV